MQRWCQCPRRAPSAAVSEAKAVDGAKGLQVQGGGEHFRPNGDDFSHEKERLLEIIDGIPKNAHGRLTPKDLNNTYDTQLELRQLLQVLRISKRELVTFFQIWDLDESGILDYREFVDELCSLRFGGSFSAFAYLFIGVHKMLQKQMDEFKHSLHEEIQELTIQPPNILEGRAFEPAEAAKTHLDDISLVFDSSVPGDRTVKTEHCSTNYGLANTGQLLLALRSNTKRLEDSLRQAVQVVVECDTQAAVITHALPRDEAVRPENNQEFDEAEFVLDVDTGTQFPVKELLLERDGHTQPFECRHPFVCRVGHTQGPDLSTHGHGHAPDLSTHGHSHIHREKPCGEAASSSGWNGYGHRGSAVRDVPTHFVQDMQLVAHGPRVGVEVEDLEKISPRCDMVSMMQVVCRE